jgi:hypothetical protein
MSTLKRATIKSYTASTHKASIQVAGSLAVWLDSVPVATDIAAAEVVAGRECAVLFFTDDNPDDAVVVTVHGAVPANPIDTFLELTDTPASYSGQASKHVAVNAGATALEFVAAAGGGGAKIADADGNTSVDTEKNANEDKVRITLAGTERGLFQTATPHVTLTGDTVIVGPIAGGTGGLTGVNSQAEFELYGGGALRHAALLSEIGVQVSVPTGEIWGIGGLCASFIGVAVTTVAGLSFVAYDAPGGDSALTNLAGCVLKTQYYRSSGYAAVNTTGRGLWVPRPTNILGAGGKRPTNATGADIEDQFSATGSNTPTQVRGIRIQAMTGGTTATGLEVADPTGGTTKLTVEIGGVLQTTPSLRVAPWTPTANLTGVYMSEGATPTLRQVQWKAGNALVAGDKVMVLV